MKKLILLFVSIGSLLTSCSSSDDNSTSDPLVGRWTYFQSFYNENEIPLDDCDKMDYLQINANGTFSEEYFFDNGTTCESDGADNGLWANTGNNIYKVTYDVGTVDEEILFVTIIFSSNKFTIETTEGSDTYKEVYVRV